MSRSDSGKIAIIAVAPMATAEQIDDLFDKIHLKKCGPIPLQCHHVVILFGCALAAVVGALLAVKERAIPKFGTRDFFAAGIFFSAMFQFISAALYAAHRDQIVLNIGIGCGAVGVGLFVFSVSGFLACGCMWGRKIPDTRVIVPFDPKHPDRLCKPQEEDKNKSIFEAWVTQE
jgi:hypothetical protein